MPRRLVAVHVGLRVADRAEQGDPRPQLDVAGTVKLLGRDRGELPAAPRGQQVEQPPVVVELRRRVPVGPREVGHAARGDEDDALRARACTAFRKNASMWSPATIAIASGLSAWSRPLTRANAVWTRSTRSRSSVSGRERSWGVWAHANAPTSIRLSPRPRRRSRAAG